MWEIVAEILLPSSLEKTAAGFPAEKRQFDLLFRRNCENKSPSPSLALEKVAKFVTRVTCKGDVHVSNPRGTHWLFSSHTSQFSSSGWRSRSGAREAAFFCPAIYEHLRVHFVHGHVAAADPLEPAGFPRCREEALENGTFGRCDRV